MLLARQLSHVNSTIAQLTEFHCMKLVLASEVLHIEVAIMLSYETDALSSIL